MLHAETITCCLEEGIFETNSGVKFEAMAHLETRDDTEVVGSLMDPRISTLATSALAKRKLAYEPESTQLKVKKTKRVGTDLVAETCSNDKWRKELHDVGQTIQNHWVIDESAVIIPCNVYVVTVLAACMILVAGGIALGFTLGGRVTSVDPFNITVFCWILAGFVAAVSKSLKVKDWSWRDFLKRRCVCRSVTELSSATGVDSQLIIAYLLHNEDFTIIRVRGPFNMAFLHRDSDGFAIDVKPTLRTLLLSGLIPAQVVTLKGPMLAILEARKNALSDKVNHYHPAPERDDEHTDLVCRMPQTKIDTESASGTQDMVMEIAKPEWFRVLGVYNDLGCNFR